MVQAVNVNASQSEATSGAESALAARTGGTPCIGICSSGIGDRVCRGCMRFEHEVIRWNAYTAEERQISLERIDSFLIKIIKNKIELIDFKKLNSRFNELKVKRDEAWSPYRVLYELLRQQAGRIGNPLDYGFSLLPAAAGLSLVEIKDLIEIEWHALSNAHYERYIAPAFSSGARIECQARVNLDRK